MHFVRGGGEGGGGGGGLEKPQESLQCTWLYGLLSTPGFMRSHSCFGTPIIQAHSTAVEQ